MILPKKLFFIGLSANALTLISYFWSTSQPNTSGAGMLWVLFVLPAIWGTSIITAVIFISTNKNPSGRLIWNLLSFLFCTPIPLLLIVFLPDFFQEKEPTLTISFLAYKNGYAYQSELWEYYSEPDYAYVQKYFKADSLKASTGNANVFMKDSTWVYISETLDTIRKETYQDNKLIRTVELKRSVDTQ